MHPVFGMLHHFRKIAFTHEKVIVTARSKRHADELIHNPYRLAYFADGLHKKVCEVRWGHIEPGYEVYASWAKKTKK